MVIIIAKLLILIVYVTTSTQFELEEDDRELENIALVLYRSQNEEPSLENKGAVNEQRELPDIELAGKILRMCAMPKACIKVDNTLLPPICDTCERLKKVKKTKEIEHINLNTFRADNYQGTRETNYNTRKLLANSSEVASHDEATLSDVEDALAAVADVRKQIEDYQSKETVHYKDLDKSISTLRGELNEIIILKEVEEHLERLKEKDRRFEIPVDEAKSHLSPGVASTPDLLKKITANLALKITDDYLLTSSEQGLVDVEPEVEREYKIIDSYLQEAADNTIVLVKQAGNLRCNCGGPNETLRCGCGGKSQGNSVERPLRHENQHLRCSGPPGYTSCHMVQKYYKKKKRKKDTPYVKNRMLRSFRELVDALKDSKSILKDNEDLDDDGDDLSSLRNDQTELRCGCGSRGRENSNDREAELRCGCGGRGRENSIDGEPELRCGCGGKGRENSIDREAELRCGCGAKGRENSTDREAELRCGCGGRSRINSYDPDKTLRCGCGGKGKENSIDREAELRCGCGGRGRENSIDREVELRCGCGGRGRENSIDKEAELRCGCGDRGRENSIDKEAELRCGCGGRGRENSIDREAELRCGCGCGGRSRINSYDPDKTLRCGCGGKGQGYSVERPLSNENQHLRCSGPPGYTSCHMVQKYYKKKKKKKDTPYVKNRMLRSFRELIDALKDSKSILKDNEHLNDDGDDLSSLRNDQTELRCGCGGRGQVDPIDKETELRCGCGGRGRENSIDGEAELRCGCGGKGRQNSIDREAELRCGCEGKGRENSIDREAELRCGCGGRNRINSYDPDKTLRCDCGGKGRENSNDREAELRCGCGGRGRENSIDGDAELRCGCGGKGRENSIDREAELRCGCGDRSQINSYDPEKTLRCGCGGKGRENSIDREAELRCGCGGKGRENSIDREAELRCGCGGRGRENSIDREVELRCGCRGRGRENSIDKEAELRCGCGGRGRENSIDREAELRCGCRGRGRENSIDREAELRCGCGGRGRENSIDREAELRCGCGGRDKENSIDREAELRCGCGGKGRENSIDREAELRCGCGGRSRINSYDPDKTLRCGCGGKGRENSIDREAELRCGCGGRGRENSIDREAELRCGCGGKGRENSIDREAELRCGCRGRGRENSIDRETELRCGCGGRGRENSIDREAELRCGCGGKGRENSIDREAELRCGCGGKGRENSIDRETELRCGCGGNGRENSIDREVELRCGCGGRGRENLPDSDETLRCGCGPKKRSLLSFRDVIDYLQALKSGDSKNKIDNDDYGMRFSWGRDKELLNLKTVLSKKLQDSNIYKTLISKILKKKYKKLDGDDSSKKASKYSASEDLHAEALAIPKRPAHDLTRYVNRKQTNDKRLRFFKDKILQLDALISVAKGDTTAFIVEGPQLKASMSKQFREDEENNKNTDKLERSKNKSSDKLERKRSGLTKINLHDLLKKKIQQKLDRSLKKNSRKDNEMLASSRENVQIMNRVVDWLKSKYNFKSGVDTAILDIVKFDDFFDNGDPPKNVNKYNDAKALNEARETIIVNFNNSKNIINLDKEYRSASDETKQNRVTNRDTYNWVKKYIYKKRENNINHGKQIRKNKVLKNRGLDDYVVKQLLHELKSMQQNNNAKSPDVENFNYEASYISRNKSNKKMNHLKHVQAILDTLGGYKKPTIPKTHHKWIALSTLSNFPHHTVSRNRNQQSIKTNSKHWTLQHTRVPQDVANYMNELRKAKNYLLDAKQDISHYDLSQNQNRIDSKSLNFIESVIGKLKNKYNLPRSIKALVGDARDRDNENQAYSDTSSAEVTYSRSGKSIDYESDEVKTDVFADDITGTTKQSNKTMNIDLVKKSLVSDVLAYVQKKSTSLPLFLNNRQRQFLKKLTNEPKQKFLFTDKELEGQIYDLLFGEVEERKKKLLDRRVKMDKQQKKMKPGRMGGILSPKLQLKQRNTHVEVGINAAPKNKFKRKVRYSRRTNSNGPIEGIPFEMDLQLLGLAN